MRKLVCVCVCARVCVRECARGVHRFLTMETQMLLMLYILRICTQSHIYMYKYIAPAFSFVSFVAFLVVFIPSPLHKRLVTRLLLPTFVFTVNGN